MAYKAEIAVKVNGLKDIRTLETSLNKISGKISAINKISIGNSKAAKIEEKVAKSKEAQRVSMIQTRRVGDAVQRSADKGLQTEKALAAVKRASKADSQNQLKVATAQRKIALEELNIVQKELVMQQKLTSEKVKQAGLTAGDRVGLLGLSGKANRISGKAASAIDAQTASRQPKGLPSSEMLKAESRGITRIVTQEERRTKALQRSAGFSKEIMESNKASAKAGEAHARKLERMNKPHGFTAQQFGPQFASSTLPTESALNFDRRTGKLLKGPAGSSPNTLGNLGRRFDTQSALISGAFPLLFGQGPVGAAAGALGGGVGGMFGSMGGFAGGIAATAAVQSIQNAINAISELGQAMGPFTQNTQAVTDALGFQGSAEEARIKLIEQTKGKTAAFNAAMNLMASQIGQKGVDSIKQFGDSTRLLGSQFSFALSKLQAFTAGIANFVIRITGLQDSLEAGAATRTVAAAAGEGNAEAQALVNRRNAAQSMKSRGGEGRRKKQLLEELSAEEQIFAIRRNTSIEADTLTQKFDALGTSIKTEAEETKRIAELRRDGLNPALAKTIAGIETEGQLAKDNLQVEIDKIKQKLVTTGELKDKDQLRLEELVKAKQAIDGQVDGLSEAATATDKLNESTKDMKSNFEKIGESIASGVSDNLTAAIMQTKTLGDAAKSILNDLANTLVKLGVNTILGGIAPGIFGSLPMLNFASGGRPPTGRPSIVGEKGPELFVPKRSGTIIPNDKLGGGGSTNISVNVDASGSSVQGDEQQSKELGRAISAAIQSELLKQRRPGGLLR